MSIDRVKLFFEQYRMEDRIQEFPVSSATVELAAKALGIEGKRIAKTLSFLKDDGCILIVTAGDGKVDNRKFKETFHQKARLVPFEQVEQWTGHQPGGVCPFAVREGVPVYLDVSLKRFQTVFPACGSSNSAMEMSLEELERYSAASGWVDVCKDWQQEP